MTASLAPLPVVVPLAMAALLLLIGRFLPWRIPDLLALLTALAVTAMTLAAVAMTDSAPMIDWLGNWSTRQGQVIGIGFVISQADAAIGALIGLLFAASFLFAWGFFEDIRAFFHVLMLLFLAAMEGFSLTHDIFNLFVWFEVMSVTAFALTGYRLEAPQLEGALNFTVTNSIGSFMMLGGIGLLYLRFGALDFGALGQGTAAAPGDPVVLGAFCLLAAALLIKGAMVPMHMWLADAHAVAPSPVSVIFSGAMVPLGLFGLAKLYWEVFPEVPAVAVEMRTLLLALGAASAIIGGLACLGQRHLKRLLAFSTISHVGLMLCGVALLAPRGLGGTFAYLGGHGLVKGALFMLAGIILARLDGVDEMTLRGAGGRIMPAGIALAVAGVLLGGAPIGLLDRGARLLDRAASDTGNGWLIIVLVLSEAWTGAAVLRAAGRIFLGWGEASGEEEEGPSEQEEENSQRPLWLMMLPVIVLLALALAGGGARASRFAVTIAARFIAWDGGASLGHLGTPPGVPPLPEPHPWAPWLATGLAILIAAHNLGRGRMPKAWLVLADRLAFPPLRALEMLHDGVVGDYVAWILVGLALLSTGFLVIAL